MADQQKGMPGQSEMPGGGQEIMPEIKESADVAVRTGSTPEKSKGGGDKAEELRQKLEIPAAKGAVPETAAGEPDVELLKEKKIQQIVMEAMAAGENFGAVEEILKKANKYIDKYTGIVDEVHDRYIEARNEQSGGMY